VATLNSTGWPGLVANVVAAWAVLLLVNVPAPLLGLRFDDGAAGVALEPPGWLVVAAWLLLFPGMGVARWLLLRAPSPAAAATANLVIVLALLCATYAYYTLLPARLTGISSAVFGLAGNLLVIAVSVGLASRASSLSRQASALLAAVALWTAFATISVVQIVRR
jgi:tryptophan-rich sensory protein